MEPSSEVSMCLEPLTAMGKWQWGAGCLLKSHCIDVSGARGGCLEVSHFFFFTLGTSETEFPCRNDGARAT